MMANHIVGSYARKPSARDGVPKGELSERETEVLRLIAFGHSYKEIAAQLGVSARTVETYKTRLMEKLSIRTRADIVRYAQLKGWLQDT
jgi:DNA-binding NarL/FixJ family response regulator